MLLCMTVGSVLPCTAQGRTPCSDSHCVRVHQIFLGLLFMFFSNQQYWTTWSTITTNPISWALTVASFIVRSQQTYAPRVFLPDLFC